MEAILRLARRATYADYLAVEEHSEHRHELLDGVIVAMAGGSDEHNAIAGRFAMLGLRAAGNCRYFTPDQRYWIAAYGRSRYADGSIICGKPDHPPHDGQATVNPLVVLEVLSPSSDGDDHGDKREDFQSLASLRAYVLACQDARRVKVYRRDEAGDWCREPEIYGRGQTFDLPSMAQPLAVDELYDNVLDELGRSLLR